MALITLRASTTSVGPASTSAKTTPLTNAEIDNNFINLNADSALRMVIGTPWVSGATSAIGQIIYYSSTLTSATPTINYYVVTAYTGVLNTVAPSHTSGSAANGGATLLWIAKPNYNAIDLLAQIKYVDGAGSGLDADLLDGYSTSTANAINTVVLRDGAGSFAAGTITATLIGNVTGALTGNASTATNGVVTTGSYSDPAWITALAGSKVTSIPNTSLLNNTVTINGTAVALGNSIDVRSAAYPIGSVYISTLSTNPNTLLGFGTWVAFGAGRVLIGDGGGFTAGSLGGSADAIVPSHTHSATSAVTDPGHVHQSQYDARTPSGIDYTGAGSEIGGMGFPYQFPTTASTTGITVGTTVATTGVSGVNANLQPYIVVYMWNRTA